MIPALRFQAVSFARDGRSILSDLSLSVEGGQSLALLGRNGSGKSTLLRLLLGIVGPDSGAIEVVGRPLSKLPAAERAKIFGYVPQAVETSLPIPVLDFVGLSLSAGSSFRAMSREELSAAESALEFFGARRLSAQPMQSLSGGERQRVLLAAAIVHQPKILLLDEPGAFLDPLAQEELAGLMRRMAAERRFAILAVTHDLGRAAGWAGRAIGLRDGRIVYDGSPEALRRPDVFNQIYAPEDQAALSAEAG